MQGALRLHGGVSRVALRAGPQAHTQPPEAWGWGAGSEALARGSTTGASITREGAREGSGEGQLDPSKERGALGQFLGAEPRRDGRAQRLGETPQEADSAAWRRALLSWARAPRGGEAGGPHDAPRAHEAGQGELGFLPSLRRPWQ